MKADENTIRKNQLVDLINNQVKNDTIITKKLMGDELIKYAVANKGVIDVNDPFFSKGIEFLLHSQPAPGTFKLTNVEAGTQDKINKAKDQGLTDQDFTNAKDTLKNLRSDLENKTKSNEGIRELVSESLKTASLSQVPFWKEGLNDINDPSKGTRLMGLDPTDKLNLTEQLKPHVKFPDNLKPFLTNGVDVVAKDIGPVVQKTMAQFFAIDSSKNSDIPVLDKKKLTPDNLKRFGEDMTKNLEELGKEIESKQNN